MMWHWPQWVMAVTFSIRTIRRIYAACDEPRTDIASSVIAGILATVIDVGILYFGGFWTP
jgi:hypothetical protein